MTSRLSFSVLINLRRQKITKYVKKTYLVGPLVLLLLLSSCSKSIDDNSEENKSQEIISSPDVSIPSEDFQESITNVIQTEEPDMFLPSTISPSKFQELNSKKVEYEDITVNFIFESGKTTDVDILDVVGWGEYEKFIPSECEFHSPTGYTSETVEDKSIKGILWNWQNVKYTRDNWNRANVLTYAHVTTVFNNFSTAENIWQVKLNAYDKCASGYTKKKLDGFLEEVSPAGVSEYYSNEDRNLVLGIFVQDEGKVGSLWHIEIHTYQGGTIDFFKFTTGFNYPQDQGFGFFNNVIQESINQNALIQKIEPINVSLENLSSILPK